MILISYFDAFVVGAIISCVTSIVTVPLAVRYLTPDNDKKEN